jgi:hypothetical protein
LMICRIISEPTPFLLHKANDSDKKLANKNDRLDSAHTKRLLDKTSPYKTSIQTTSP